MRRQILKFANACMYPFGLRYHGRSNPVRTRMEDGLRHLVKRDCQPTTCIDVGAAYGTLDLYEAFPNAKHLLIEPLSEYEPEIKRLMKHYECYYVQAAAGSAPGITRINVKKRITGSSIFSERQGIDQGTSREVRTVTLDQVCKEMDLPGPYLIKIDVEGAETEVIKGANNTMSDTLAAILELTFVARLVDAPEAGEIIRFMEDRDFVLYDVFNLRVRDDHTLFQADAVFVPRNSYLRL